MLNTFNIQKNISIAENRTFNILIKYNRIYESVMRVLVFVDKVVLG